ncbi:histidine kinase [Dethiosulfovibrio peptidovorans DSM 11002]|uniref:histidine kinase n=1 Tax=Dethiosulfovibrio peptidovorans DSM 11002 TaxID=469381 RepID=D2Z6I4_9BACT|nr:ATP-binding protein [Dethiosulfovibrio peptidovorans]EFC91081.1 histidine kinase [Dethiosulfovibrio peptidovorans DSM 11002]
MKSIKRSLLWGLVLGTVLCSSAVMVILFLAIREEIYEIMDYQMEQTALAAHLNGRPKELDTSSGFEEETISSVIQIRDKSGRLIYSTDPSAEVEAVGKTGFSHVSGEGEGWRVYVLSRKGRDIQVSQPISKRRQTVIMIAMETAGSLLSLAAVLALWIYLVVNKSFKPLKELCDSIRSRKASRLDPVNETEVPEEIMPLVVELNALLARLDDSIRRQKRFIADAAHELRTPLTAVDLQIQNTLEVPEEAEMGRMLKKMKKGIGRATAMVNQLLSISRTEETLGKETEDVDIMHVLRAVLSEYGPSFEMKRISLRLLEPIRPVTVRGNRYGLKTMISSLIDNSLKYSPRESSVTVKVRGEGQTLILEIEDEGPGIPNQERERVFRRFYRYHGERAMGSGLGLAIAKNVTDYHGGRISIEDGEGRRGTKMVVTLPIKGK